GVLPIAAMPIVTFARARRGPLHVSWTANLSSIHVATSGMKNPAPRPMSPLMPENFKRGRQSIVIGRASRGRKDFRSTRRWRGRDSDVLDASAVGTQLTRL